jgi:hypothetical protein
LGRELLQRAGRLMNRMRKKTISLLLWPLLLASGGLASGLLPNNQWDLLVIAYPPDRDVAVTLGGAERTLTSKGLCKIKYQNEGAAMEIEIRDLPASQAVGWPGTQYVLWAIDEEKRATNLGAVPLSGDDAKWNVRIPLRVFGLLVTAEKNAQATAPSTAVVLESLLPTDRYLVVPVFRVQVDLAPPQG